MPSSATSFAGHFPSSTGNRTVQKSVRPDECPSGGAVFGVEDDDRVLAGARGAVGDVAVRVVDHGLGDLLAAVEAGGDVVVDGVDGAAGDGVVGGVLEEEAPGVAEEAAGGGDGVLSAEC